MDIPFRPKSSVIMSISPEIKPYRFKHTAASSFSHWVVDHPWITIQLILILVLVAACGARYLRFTTDYRIFFSADNPELQTFDALQNTYSKSDNLLFIVAPKNGDVFTKETLAMVRDLTTEAWQMPYSTRVDSIANFQHTVADENDLIVQDLVRDPPGLSDDEIKQIRGIALSEPALLNRLISERAHVTAINVTIQLPGKSLGEVQEVATAARALLKTMQNAHPEIDIHLTGMVMLNNAFAELSKHDAQTLIPTMFLVMICLVGVIQRSIIGTAGIILVILISVVTAMGLTGWLGWALSAPSAAAPTIILAMSVADCVHLLASFHHYLGRGLEKRAAMEKSILVNYRPIIITSVTTSIGFLTMNFSESPPFRDLGNIAAMGVMAACVFSMTVLPALVMLFPVRAKRRSDSLQIFMDRLAGFVIRRHRIIFWVLSVLAISVIALIPINQLNDDLISYFDKTVEFRKASEFANRNLSGIYTLEYSIDSGTPGGINEPEFLSGLNDFSDWLKKQPEVVNVNEISDTYKRINRTLHGDQQTYYKIPETRGLAAQSLLLYEMSLPYGLDLNDQINIDKSATRVIVAIRSDLSTNEILALESRIAAWPHAPNLSISGASTILMFAHIGARNMRGMLGGTVIALVLISGILLLVFRSVKIGLLSLVPNLLPIGVAFGLWAVMVGEINLSLSIVASLTLGIVVDDTVHFLSKYLSAKRIDGMAPKAAVRYAFTSVGVAIGITSVVLVCGFSVLTQSIFVSNSEMGILVAITVAIAFVFDLFLLPSLLLILEDKSDEKVIDHHSVLVSNVRTL